MLYNKYLSNLNINILKIKYMKITLKKDCKYENYRIIASIGFFDICLKD